MDDVPRQPSNQNWRVKVYLLTETGNWDDCGAGIFEIVKEIKSEEEIDFLKVTSNEDFSKNNLASSSAEKFHKLKGTSENEKCFLYLPIIKDNQFEKQGETIISWIDKNIEEEIAISFLDPAVAKDTWRIICLKTGKDPHDDRKYKDLDQLAMPTMENLEQIKSDFETRKDWMVCAIMENKNFMDKLFQVFNDSEDLESLENLHLIHSIIRMMSNNLNNTALYEIVFSEDVPLLELLLSDEYYLLVFGALECRQFIVSKILLLNIDESENRVSTKPKYREFLQNQSYYKRVIDFQDENILKKIRLNYRISYLKDSVITSIIDDPLSSQFNPISYVTNRDILEHIMSNDQYIDEVFEKMGTDPKDAIGFLYELTQIVKLVVQLDEKINFGKKLIKKNGFSAIAKSFEILYTAGTMEEVEDEKKNILKINLVDILVFLIQLELNAFIEFLKSAPDSKLMITGIINNLFYGDQGLQIQTAELIKYLVDTIHEKKNEILDIFYEGFMPSFVEHYKKLENNEKFYSFVQQFVDILIHCIKSHGYRIRHYIIHHKLLHKLYPGFKTREKSTHLALIRLIKNIALSKDEFLIKYLSNNNLLDDIFDVYLKNAFKNNLMNSACLEFFELVRKENIKSLIIEFTEKFRDRIKEQGLERFFENLFGKYDQITEDLNKEMTQEASESQSGTKLPVSTVIAENLENYNSRELSYMEDEDYFEGEDDDDENAKTKGLGASDKTNGNNGQKAPDQPLQQPMNMLSEQQIKNSKDSLQKLKDNIASKKLEAEEENKFSFGNKAKNKPPSSEKPVNMINIQLSIPSNENIQISEGEVTNGKRGGSDLYNDEEAREDGKIESQKKIKF